MKDITGQRFGKLTVLRFSHKIDGEKSGTAWECQCDCGNIVTVPRRYLTTGTKKSCGCLRREMYDLTGQRFGRLTVLRFSHKINDGHKTTWECQCDCGNIVTVPRSNLVSGNTLSCGCLKREWKAVDLTGKRFGRLVCKRPTEERKFGFVVWECQCDCGNVVYLPAGSLTTQNTLSCGCLHGKAVKAMHDALGYIDGTLVDNFKNKKLRKNNTSGYTGITMFRGKYQTGIYFQSKRYHLGTYADIKDAIAVRKKAESVLFDETLDYYDRWKAKAEADPEWARENPIKISVERVGDNDFNIRFDPLL